MANRYWVGGTGTWDSSNTANWSTASGGAGGASVPTTSSDNVFIDANSGTGTITVQTGTLAIYVGHTNSAITVLLTQNATTSTFGGGQYQLDIGTLNLNNFTLTTTYFGFSGGVLAFGSSGVINLIPTSLGGAIFNQNFSATYTGISNINISTAGTSSATYILTISTSITESKALNFTFNSGSYFVSGLEVTNSITFLGSQSLNVSTRTIYRNLTLQGTTTIVSGTNVTTFAGASGTKTITTNGSQINVPITFNGNCTWQFSGSLTMLSTRALTFSQGTLLLAAGTTNTVDLFTTSGTTLKYLASTTAGTQATITKSSGTTTVTYLNIKDSNATGGSWIASPSSGNVNAGNNTGWLFLTSVLISESCSLQDASNSTKTFFNAVSEALGLDDSSVVAAAFASASSEAITTADTPTAGTAFVSSILENLVLADSPAVLKTFNVSISEPQTIQDAANVIAAYITAISESTTIQESIIGVAAKIITDVTEAISVSNAQTAIVSFVSSSVENINVADSESPVRTQYAIVVEPLTINEEQNVFAWVRVENDTPTSWSLIDNRQ